MTKPSFEVLAYEDTPLGPLCLRRRELLQKPGTFVTEITLNHEFLMSSLNTKSECALADIALDRHTGKRLSSILTNTLSFLEVEGMCAFLIHKMWMH